MKTKVKSGDRYGKLMVLNDGENIERRKYFLCKCDCGNITTIRSDAISGGTQSCGCITKEIASKFWKKHGMRNKRIYNIWHGMKQRCLNNNNPGFKDYGGRGISICEEWEDASNFFEWAFRNGYTNEMTIERIDNNGNYEPSNCMWIKQSEQLRNTRSSVKITFNGLTLCRRDWAKKIGISDPSFQKRLKKYSIREAITKPINKEKQHYAIRSFR